MTFGVEEALDFFLCLCSHFISCEFPAKGKEKNIEHFLAGKAGHVVPAGFCIIPFF